MNNFIYRNCIDVVIPFYNGNKYINEAVESIVKNDFVSTIIIVVDLNSEEPLLNKELLTRRDILIIHNKLDISGAGVVRSIGYNTAKSKYVAFLDCDDVWYPDKCRIQLDEMTRNELAFSFAGFTHFSDSGDKIFKPIIPSSPYSLENFFKKEFTVGCLTAMIDKDLIGHVPIISLKRRNDYALWFHIISSCISKNLKWGGIEKVVAQHRISEGSLSSSKFKSAVYYFKFLRLCGLDYYRSIIYWLYYFFNTIGSR